MSGGGAEGGGPATIGAALRAGAARLAAGGIENAPGDARRLLAEAAGIAPDRLALHAAEALPGAAAARFAALLEGRLARVPVARLIGRRLFWGRSFAVTPEVLDPRPETETLVAAALEAPFAHVLDLGTGSGCLLLTLLAERPAARGLGVDLSPGALAVARGNAAALGLGARAELRASDWFSAVEGRFDLIVGNPPYIAQAEMAGLAPEVARHDPRMALTDGGDGLGAYRAIAAAAPAHLAPGGRLLLEIGPTQGAAVMALLGAAGLGALGIRADLDGRDRVVCAARTVGSP